MTANRTGFVEWESSLRKPLLSSERGSLLGISSDARVVVVDSKGRGAGTWNIDGFEVQAVCVDEKESYYGNGMFLGRIGTECGRQRRQSAVNGSSKNFWSRLGEADFCFE